MEKIAQLADRTIIRISGSDAVHFLQNLVTCEIEELREGDLTFGALLTPQGKILFEFFCKKTNDGLLFDLSSEAAEDFQKRMTFYKLRADVQIGMEPDLKVFVAWGAPPNGADQDPRSGGSVGRFYAPSAETNATADDWHEQRIMLGLPELGRDFQSGEVFPHDVNMDQFDNGGVAFTKGCYVGQEVVSRMRHRGTARKRFVILESDEELPEAGTALKVDRRAIGTMGSASDVSGTTRGLALLRLDRIAAHLNADNSVQFDELAASISMPTYASFEIEK